MHTSLVRSVHLLRIGAPRGAAMLVRFLLMKIKGKKEKKGWLVTHLVLLPHITALFMTSLIQTAGRKIAIVFSQRSHRTRNRMKLKTVCSLSPSVCACVRACVRVCACVCECYFCF